MDLPIRQMSFLHGLTLCLALGRLVLAALPFLLMSGEAAAHGLAGKRFFPTTLTVEDPFVTDELTLPTVSHLEERGEGDEPATHETEFEGEYTKTILPNLGLSFEGAFVIRDPAGESAVNGFGNLEIGLKYQFLKDAPHEAVASLGLGAEIGDTGDEDAEADPFSTLTPSLFFGKGFGDLPESLSYLRPLAITGVAGVAFPLDERTAVEGEIERNPHVLDWGFTLQYSIPYLQSSVKDVGLGAPFDRLVPVVEFALSTPLDRGQSGDTSGTISPGLIWVGQSLQMGLGALIPVNHRSGKNVGVVFQLHFFLDDIFPRSLGKPLFRTGLPSFGESL